MLNRGLDCDVIVAEVRATSHKPDEMYGIIERLSPGTRKIELFGRPHNLNPNWYRIFSFRKIQFSCACTVPFVFYAFSTIAFIVP